MAHIRDKRSDLTDIKFLNFEFMEGFVGDNYLAYHPLKKQTSFYLATPKMVFDDDRPEDEFSDPFTLFNETDGDSLSASVISSMKELLSQPMGIDPDMVENIREENMKLLENVLPIAKPGATLLDLMKNMVSFTEELLHDAPKYKELRSMIDQGINNGTITFNGNEDFNEALKNTPIKKTYLEFVKDSMYQEDKENIPKYDFHIQVYSMLDILGISKDKMSKKNRFTNIQNDAYHSYFASYCDYYITGDASTLKKTKAVYDLLDINTKVTSVEEFIELLSKQVSSQIDTLDEFFKKLTVDYTHHERECLFTDGNMTINRLKENFLYLGFFDAFIEIITVTERKLILAKSDSNPLSQPAYSEISQIINRALCTFGPDLDQKLQFEYRKHNVITDDLKTRRWKIDVIRIELGQQQEIGNKYALAVILPPLSANEL